MALVPNPTWWMDKDGVPTATTTWHFDQIIAGNNPVLTETTFYIWNNKGVTDPTLATNKMTECKVTTLDDTFVSGAGTSYSAGGHSSPLVTGSWVSLNCVKTGVAWGTMGGAYDGASSWVQQFQPIGAVGSADPTIVHAGDREIFGRANDGTFTPDSTVTADGNKDNFAKFSCRIAVPEDAIAGQVKFLLRCYYNIATGSY